MKKGGWVQMMEDGAYDPKKVLDHEVLFKSMSSDFMKKVESESNMTSLRHVYSNSLNFKYEGNLIHVGVCLAQGEFQDLLRIHDQFLHKEEKNYFLGLRFPKRQQSYLLGRYCAKQALSHYADYNELTEIWIANGIFQHPVVMKFPCNNAQISISHTEEIGAALAFAETYPMAIDIEDISLEKAKSIKPYLSYSEMQGGMFRREEEHVICLWTIREALSKVLKCGLAVPFEMLEIGSMTKRENIVLSTFKNFKQYKATVIPIEKFFLFSRFSSRI